MHELCSIRDIAEYLSTSNVSEATFPKPIDHG
jgi:hypothetical protein